MKLKDDTCAGSKGSDIKAQPTGQKHVVQLNGAEICYLMCSVFTRRQRLSQLAVSIYLRTI